MRGRMRSTHKGAPLTFSREREIRVLRIHRYLNSYNPAHLGLHDTLSLANRRMQEIKPDSNLHV